jgi:hypothetical protein
VATTELDSNGKYLFPGAAYNAQNYALVTINIALIPYFRIFFAEMQERYHWSTREDWWRSYQAFAEIEEMLMGGAIQQITDRQDQLYRLVDSTLNGTAYTATTDPDTQATTIAPEIPVVPELPEGITAGLRRQLLDAQGVLPAGWLGFGSTPATTADVVRALRNDTAGQVQRARTAITALQQASQIATIFGTVADFLEEGASDVAEGGILITSLIGLMSNAAMMGLQAGQLDSLLVKMDRLISSLDGGATEAPGDSVLTALRGDTEAGADRNVIDSSGGAGGIAELLDQVEPLLTDIKGSLQ